jgi:hypothetical protein
LESDERSALSGQKTASLDKKILQALAEEWGVDVNRLTKNERGRLNDAAKQLAAVGATAEEVAARSRRYRVKYPKVDWTPQALASNWSTLAAGAVAGRDDPIGRLPACDGCGFRPFDRDVLQLVLEQRLCSTCRARAAASTDEGP